MHQQSIGLLNKAIADELSAVHQYMYFHFHCDDQGYDLLAGLFKRTAIEEMLHVERLAERILFLKGDAEMGVAEKVQKIHDVKEMLQLATKMEEKAQQGIIISGRMNVQKMPIPFPKNSSKTWLWMKSVILINMIRKWIICRNSGKNTWLCSRSSVVKIYLYPGVRHNK